MKEKSGIFCKDKDKERVEFALKELTKIVSPDGVVNGMDFLKRDQCKSILDFSIRINGLEGSGKKEEIIENAFLKIRRENKYSAESFANALKHEINLILDKNIEKFHILFLLNIDTSVFKNKRHFAICNNKLYCRTQKYILKNFDLNQFNTEANYLIDALPSSSLSLFEFFEYISEGGDGEEAFRNAYQDFELFRAILNFSDNFGVCKYSYNEEIHINSFLPSYFYLIFDSKYNYQDYRYTREKFTYKKLKLSPHFKPTLFKKLINMFLAKPSDNSLKRLILEAIIGYSQALDSLELESNFLRLWQILELITFSSEESSIKNATNKVKLLFNQKPLWNYTLDWICQQRNELVHKGNFPEEGLKNLNILKYIVDQCLYQLIIFNKYFSDKSDLQLFYELESEPYGSLKKRVKVINKIIKFRK